MNNLIPFTAYSGSPYTSPTTRKRPVGLTVLAVLFIIGSILMISSGASTITAGGWLAAAYNLGFGIVGLLVAIFMIVGRYYTVVLGYTIAALVLGIIVGGITIASLAPLLEFGFGVEFIAGFVAGTAISLIIYLIIIWYLRKPHVQAFFGRVPLAPTPSGVGMPFTPPPPPQAAPTPTCPTCRAMLQYVPQYQRYWCPNCRAYV